MDAHPYWYIVPLAGDVQAALDALRDREFAAGRYNPVTPFVQFPIDFNSPSPGKRHASIAAAMAAAGQAGTRSILDIAFIADGPAFGMACPLDDVVLSQLYGTEEPSRKMVDGNMDYLDGIDRGQAIYIPLYAGGRATEVLFAGYAFD